MRYRWVVLGTALLLGVGAGAAIASFRTSPGAPASRASNPSSQMTWAAGKKAAPDFALRDESGRPISLQRFHGRPVILTFIDPLCTTFCPVEARVLNRTLAQLPSSQRPAIVAVSVNRRGDNARAYRHDAKAWQLTSAWHWAVGSQRALAGVWKSYGIGVEVDPKSKDVTHTEAAYLVDASGHMRALYLWPFSASGVLRGLRALAG